MNSVPLDVASVEVLDVTSVIAVESVVAAVASVVDDVDAVSVMVLSVVDFVELDVAPAVGSESVVAVDVDASVADDVESESAWTLSVVNSVPLDVASGEVLGIASVIAVEPVVAAVASVVDDVDAVSVVVLSVVDFVELDVAPSVADESVVVVDVDASVAETASVEVEVVVVASVSVAVSIGGQSTSSLLEVPPRHHFLKLLMRPFPDDASRAFRLLHKGLISIGLGALSDEISSDDVASTSKPERLGDGVCCSVEDVERFTSSPEESLSAEVPEPVEDSLCAEDTENMPRVANESELDRCSVGDA